MPHSQARDRTFPGTGTQIIVFLALLLAGALVAYLLAPWIMSVVVMLWSWVETLPVRLGWVAASRPFPPPAKVGMAPRLALCCAWLALLFAGVGLRNFCLLRSGQPQRVLLTLPPAWRRSLHLDGGNVVLTWAVGPAALFVAVLIATTKFT